MKYCIPGEMWNQIGVPENDTTETNVSTLLSEIAYKLPYVSDMMMTKELWHAVCDISMRFGALRERLTGTVTSASPSLTLIPTHGTFIRVIGAGLGGNPVGLSQVSTSRNSSGYSISFDTSLLSTSQTAYADVSVLPDAAALPANQKVPLWFLKEYGRALYSCALMRICSMDGEKWSDMSAARMHATSFLGEMSRISHGLITSGMRKTAMIDAESILVSRTVQQQTDQDSQVQKQT